MSGEMNERQFLKMYDTYADAIFRHCFFRIHDREEAKDLTQEIFLRVWEYISRGKKIDNLKAFLYRVANNRIIDEYRKKKKDFSLDSLQDEGFDVGEESHETTLAVFDGALALKKLEELDDPYRSVILLRYVECLSIKEIADAVNQSENVVSVRLHRGIKQLQKLYNHGEQI